MSEPRVQDGARTLLDSAITLWEADRDHILKALKETNWLIGGRGGPAARLGLKRTTLIGKMHKLGLSRPIKM
jgi:formate hydrogenlyase transcriptional activator